MFLYQCVVLYVMSYMRYVIVSHCYLEVVRFRSVFIAGVRLLSLANERLWSDTLTNLFTPSVSLLSYCHTRRHCARQCLRHCIRSVACYIEIHGSVNREAVPLSLPPSWRQQCIRECAAHSRMHCCCHFSINRIATSFAANSTKDTLCPVYNDMTTALPRAMPPSVTVALPSSVIWHHCKNWPGNRTLWKRCHDMLAH